MIDLHFDDESNVIRLGAFEMEAYGNRILVLGDSYKSGYECDVCGGKLIVDNKSVVPCESCHGDGKSIISKAARCARCEGRGWQICSKCNGLGTRDGGLVIPEDRQAKPTTGRIVSKGPEVTRLENGQSVMFGSFSGHCIDLKAPTTDGKFAEVSIWILREDEVMSKVRGDYEASKVRRSAAMHTAA